MSDFPELENVVLLERQVETLKADPQGIRRLCRKPENRPGVEEALANYRDTRAIHVAVIAGARRALAATDQIVDELEAALEDTKHQVDA